MGFVLGVGSVLSGIGGGGIIGRDQMEQDHQEEHANAHEVGGRSQLHIGDHNYGWMNGWLDGWTKM